ncbi:methyl-accepting chemotaxis protein [Reichenbachiella agarivorans]|uniref:Methyl-accepting chemotaxis protein n=1 Tax=Reichenbachiella agarivorans TaxID=2979464 RepID=A0ABY6CS01_9BACT|nr:methyl-accepting chemotaxis protein [Reichenbachiella agarivorans]UXP33292.1 methyl-accepting chemotaxis protein [Reichenbachiella agarivorans]
MTIKDKLNSVIGSISGFSRQTNMVAINAAIHAGKLSQKEGAPFQVLAREIQNMSDRSMTKLEELDKLIDEIEALSKLINVTGSQRMLLMKLVNSVLMDDAKMKEETIQQFEKNMEAIRLARINISEQGLMIESIGVDWDELRTDLGELPIDTLNQRVVLIIQKINQLLSQYEKLSGH